MNEVKNFGLIISPITNRKEGAGHILGAAGLPEPVINSSGDWIPHLPVGEKQSRQGVETNGCTLHGTETAIETLIGYKTDVIPNYSERYLTNLAKHKGILNPNAGADPHKIAEMRRNESGTVSEERAPWNDSIKTAAEYYSLDFMPLIPEALKWYKGWKLNHKWLWSGSPTPQEKRERIKDALTKGTVCASVVAWKMRNGLYYKEIGEGDGHWVNVAQA